ncbi:NAD(P)H-dependent oxidoreductase subunit E [bacterium]|nr:NAD(P)H-dependent oxidoreductase subunit E [bacterium]
MEKITVKICLGTACFVMGGAELQDLADIIPAKFGDKVAVEGSTCLELCSEEYAKAPFVLVNDIVIDKATKEKVLSKIEELLK